MLLPTFLGYTVDERLREFRKIDADKPPVFLPFDSEEGGRLCLAWISYKWYRRDHDGPDWERQDERKALKAARQKAV